MGRYSQPLAAKFADAAGIAAAQLVLDVGCGPGALTSELVMRLGAGAVAAVDPSPPFVGECARRNPGVDLRTGAAEELPFPDESFDAVLAQLVLHFVTNPEAAAVEMRRVLRPDGVAAACVWDFSGGMAMLRDFWGAARAVDPSPPDEAMTRRFGRAGEIDSLFEGAGLRDVEGGALEIEAAYEDFDDLWAGFLTGTGPAGTYCVGLEPPRQKALKDELWRRLGTPARAFTLPARAWYALGRR